MGTVRAEQKAATRARLREAARHVFGAVGVERATIGAITKKAGTAHGTFYVHFEDKDQVLAELMSELNQELVEALQAAWSAHGLDDLESLLQLSVTMFLDHWSNHRDLVRVGTRHLMTQLPLESARDGFNPEAQGMLTPWLEKLLGEQRGLSSVRLVGPAILAMWGRVGFQYLFSGDVTREEATETLVKMTAGALRGVA